MFDMTNRVSTYDAEVPSAEPTAGARERPPLWVFLVVLLVLVVVMLALAGYWPE